MCWIEKGFIYSSFLGFHIQNFYFDIKNKSKLQKQFWIVILQILNKKKAQHLIVFSDFSAIAARVRCRTSASCRASPRRTRTRCTTRPRPWSPTRCWSTERRAPPAPRPASPDYFYWLRIVHSPESLFTFVPPPARRNDLVIDKMYAYDKLLLRRLSIVYCSLLNYFVRSGRNRSVQLCILSMYFIDETIFGYAICISRGVFYHRYLIMYFRRVESCIPKL